MLNIVRNEGTGQLKTVTFCFWFVVFETETKQNKIPQPQVELKKLRCFLKQKFLWHLLFGGNDQHICYDGKFMGMISLFYQKFISAFSKAGSVILGNWILSSSRKQKIQDSKFLSILA